MLEMKPRRSYHFVYYSLCVLFYACAVVVYAFWSDYAARWYTMQSIDERLTLAAKSLKYMLAPDFHDRAIDPDSISREEELKNRQAISSFAFETEFEWLYTLVEKEGKFYFSAPTVSEEEAKERDSWYFYSYEDIPDSFVQSYHKHHISFNMYTDQWGVFRSVAIPQTSPGGRTYLACADYKISDINRFMVQNHLRSAVTALYFLLASIPLIFLFYRVFRSYNIELLLMNRELTEHKIHLEDLVDERTNELRVANERLSEEISEREIAQNELQEKHDGLQKALNDVKLLSGLLPICGHCKKIRDDQGYWNQIEQYIADHSSAEFSHSICPACIAKYYPNYKPPQTENPTNGVD